MKNVLLIIWLMLIAQVVVGQVLWDYLKCADYALAHNPDVLSGEIDMKRQELNYKNSINGLLPSVSGNVRYNINKGRSIDPNTNKVVEKSSNGFFSNNYGLNARISLFNGFYRLNRIAYEKYNLQIAQDRLASAQNNLVYSILEQYGRVLHFNGLVEIYDEHYRLTRKELEETKRRYELGIEAKTEIYEMEARLSNHSYSRLYYRNKAQKALLQLKQNMNFPVDSALTLKEIDHVEVVNSFNETGLYNQAMKILPEVRILEKKLLASKKEIQMIRSEMAPSISAYAGASTGYFETKTDSLNRTLPFRTQMDGNLSTNYGVSMSIPIFRGFQKHNQLKRAKLGYEQQKIAQKKALDNIEYQIAEAIMDLNAEKEKYLAAQKNEKSQNAAYAVAVKKRENGMISLMDFYESRNNLANSKTEVLASKIQLFLKEKVIQFYLTGTFL